MNNFQNLVEIIKILRSPKGCPWDREQTLETLKPHLLEETYEVLEAMDTGGENLKSELGDLLLQIIFQANISEEKGEFNIDDVIDKIKNKMISRHPHVFQKNVTIKNSDEVLINWEKIKSQEKEHQNRKSILDGIPTTFPSLLEAEKIQKKAAKVGFDFGDVEPIFSKIEEELDEVRSEIEINKKEKIEEEIGDLFFAVVNLARYLNVNPEICLKKANNKFKKRFQYIEKNCNLEKSSLYEMDLLWNEAKNLE